jgi:hypothetical protein
MIGLRGRYLEMRCAEWPEVVRTTMAAALLLLAASTAAIAVVCEASKGKLTLKI